MEPFIFLGGDRDSILELNILLTVILCANTDKLFILNHVQGNQTFLTVFDLHHTFNGIIQHISEKSTDIHILHKIQQLSLTHKFQLNTMSLTMHAFTGKNGVKDLISRFILCFINLDLTLHLFQVFPCFLGICAAFQKVDLMLQIMVFLIYNIDTLLGKLVIFVLHIHNIPKCILLKTHLDLFYLNVISIKHRHTAEIRQCTDNKHIHSCSRTENAFYIHIAYIADAIHHNQHKIYNQQFSAGDLQLLNILLQITFDQIDQYVQYCINNYHMKYTP